MSTIRSFISQKGFDIRIDFFESWTFNDFSDICRWCICID